MTVPLIFFWYSWSDTLFIKNILNARVMSQLVFLWDNTRHFASYFVQDVVLDLKAVTIEKDYKLNN